MTLFQGPSVEVFPTKLYIHISEECKQTTTKNFNLINSSEMPGQYHVQYDCINCPVKCNPSIGIVKNRVQIKLELKPWLIGYYYKRLYILIMNHVSYKSNSPKIKQFVAENLLVLLLLHFFF